MIIIRIIMHALPEKQKELTQTLLSLIEPLGKENDGPYHEVFYDINDQTVFNLISEWENRQLLDQYMMSDDFGIFLGTKSLLREPLKIQIHTISKTEGKEAVNAVRKKIN